MSLAERDRVRYAQIYRESVRPERA